MKDKLLVVKIGGSIIENDLILNDFLNLTWVQYDHDFIL